MVNEALLLNRTSTLGNYISTNINQINVIVSVSDQYKRCNWVISDFRTCDRNTLIKKRRFKESYFFIMKLLLNCIVSFSEQIVQSSNQIIKPCILSILLFHNDKK